MKKYDGLKHSGDDTDAAQLLRLGILPTGYIYPREQRGLRDLARRRMQLVRQRSMHVLAVENVQACETGTRMSADKIKRLSVRAVDELGYMPEVAMGISANVAVIGALNEPDPQAREVPARARAPQARVPRTHVTGAIRSAANETKNRACGHEAPTRPIAYGRLMGDPESKAKTPRP